LLWAWRVVHVHPPHNARGPSSEYLTRSSLAMPKCLENLRRRELALAKHSVGGGCHEPHTQTDRGTCPGVGL
jgi:hypothetical protein